MYPYMYVSVECCYKTVMLVQPTNVHVYQLYNNLNKFSTNHISKTN